VEKARSWKDFVKFNKIAFRLFYLPGISIVVPLLVAGGPISYPGRKSEVLIRLHKIQEKRVNVILLVRNYYCFTTLVATWDTILDPCRKSDVLIGTHRFQ